MIERKIIIGLIISTEYLTSVRTIWDSLLIESSTARILAKWCIDHFDKYKKAPGKDIETIFFQQVDLGNIDKEIAEEIELEILPELSDEYTAEGINLDYLIPETLDYLKSRQLSQHGEQLQNILENGQGGLSDRIKEAEALQNSFTTIATEVDESLNLNSRKAIKTLRKIFEEAVQPIIKFPKQLGKFWNDQFIPGAFIAFLAPEKRGKSYELLDIAMLGAKQGKNVALFQAGDMNEHDQLERVAQYLTKKSMNEIYCKKHYEAVRDCKKNQFDTCDKQERECAFGIRQSIDDGEGGEFSYEDSLTKEELVEEFINNPDYKPCYNCSEFDSHKLGTPWLKEVPESTPLTLKEAQKAWKDFFVRHNRNFMLDSYVNGGLSTDMIITKLDYWWKKDKFEPDIIIVDYADLLTVNGKLEERHRQNQIWKDLRKISQTKIGRVMPMMLTATQADGQSYTAHTLKLGNFSEDKRKYAHVTAFYGLNQDPKGIEKDIGILRINELIKRKGEFSIKNVIAQLQNLRQGRPFTGSYFTN